MMQKIINSILGSILVALIHAQFVLGKMCISIKKKIEK
jgi:hypothetical protein